MVQLIIFLYAVLCVAIYNPERFLSASLSPYIWVLLLFKQQFVVTHWYTLYKRQKKPARSLTDKYVNTLRVYDSMVKHFFVNLF
jgi:hypothetical protein